MIYDIVETVTCPKSEVSLDVLAVQKTGGWIVKPNEIISVDWGMTCEIFTPIKLRKLGEWLVAQANRIQEQYDSKGQPKKEIDLKK